MTISLDSPDRRILNLIQVQASLTHQEIAERTGVSATSVWRRIKNLEEVGVIRGRVALLDPKKIGMQVCALISLRLVRHGEDTRIEFEDFIASRPEIMECYAVVGDYDYMLVVMVPTVEDYEIFLSRHLLSHALVASSNSSFTLRRVKYTTAHALAL
ncbi:MAG: Lrp/AsnC family transcriptional regulator [Alphaproteobacteria bacterium]|nr:Lrp/AsnC family transcriptional regulator [Alphaproteobacteria bacterium]